jgi:4-carboxymuconolactone decarboxylase
MDEVFEKGAAMRRAVVGAAYVDRATADPFTQPLQELLTRYCWGSVWSREGLPPKTRSLLTLVLLAALGKPNELRLHTVGALRNGCTVDEIREALLHATVYLGFPAGIEAFRNASEALKEAGAIPR